MTFDSVGSGIKTQHLTNSLTEYREVVIVVLFIRIKLTPNKFCMGAFICTGRNISSSNISWFISEQPKFPLVAINCAMCNEILWRTCGSVSYYLLVSVL